MTLLWIEYYDLDYSWVDRPGPFLRYYHGADRIYWKAELRRRRQRGRDGFYQRVRVSNTRYMDRRIRVGRKYT